MFVKGQSGNPAGRTPGSKNLDRLNYLDLQIWFKQMFETLEDIKNPNERMVFQMQIADKLLAKIANLPQNPEESVANAKARQDMLTTLEGGGPKEPQPSDSPGGTDSANPHS